jgi:subtilase family serine protease
MKRTTVLLRACTVALGFFCALVSKSQTIPADFFGVNAWMPDTIGNASACVSTPCVLWGKLHSNWQKVKDSKAKLVRFGGIAADKNKPTNYQYIKMIDSIRANGMEPIIQVPYYNGYYTASQAASIVQYINVTRGRAVKYWIIGNEPNLTYNYTSASQVAPYIKSFASAMKAVDTTIRIIGPEFAGFHQTMTNDLTNPNGPYDITGRDANGRFYIDYFSYHTYPMGNANSILPSRNDVITKLTSFGSFQDELVYLNGRLATANATHTRTGTSALKAAVTEVNVDYYNNSADNLYGVGANSFLGGQFVAEMYGIGMKQGAAFINLWSTIEGNSVMSNIGFLDGTSATRKPLFYHVKMMAENFNGNYINSTDNQSNIKTFACKSSSLTTVMILNQDASVNYTYTVRLNTSTVSGSSPLKINVDATTAVEYSDFILNQSTVLLTFDLNGNLVKKTVYTLSSEAANNLPPVTYTYTYSATDLVIQTPSLSSNTVTANGNLSLSSVIYNNGSTAALSSNVGYYLSSDTLYSSSDQYLGTSSGGSLNANSGSTKQATVTIPNIALGNYYLLFYADHTNAVNETNENNNVKAISLSVIGNTIEPLPLLPDLFIQSATINTGSVIAGNKINMTSVIYNGGALAASSSKTGYYLSTDTLLNSADTYLGFADGFTLNAGSSATKTMFLKIPMKQSTGNYYILSFADHVNWVSENNEQNNVRYSNIFVQGRKDNATYSFRSSQSDSLSNMTAIQDLNTASEFKIYPNPSNGKITVEIPSLNKETSLHYQVMDLTGKIIYDRVINTDQNEIIIEIPQGFVNGVYILRMSFNNNVVSKNIMLVN